MFDEFSLVELHFFFSKIIEMRRTLRAPLLFYFFNLFIYFFVVFFFLSTNLLDFPLKILGSKLVFQVSRVFVFLPKKLLESPRTLDKIINNMHMNLIFKP